MLLSFLAYKGIQGGFTKTNMTIGQLHYASNPEFKIPNDERGILMCYTWKSEALLFKKSKTLFFVLCSDY